MHSISFSTYGRSIKNSDWSVSNTMGMNRIYYIHSGSVIYGSGKSSRTLLPGRLYLFPQNLLFELVTETADKLDHTYLDFLSVPVIMMNDFLEIPLDDYPIIKSATKILADLVEAYPMWQLPRKEEIHALITSYLNNLLFLINEEFAICTIHDTMINDAMQYMYLHLGSKISITELADKYHLEKNVFIRKFKKYTNTTPYQYLMNLRVNMALSLLQGNQYTLSQAAEMVGYSDATALSHAIKKVCQRSCRPIPS